MINDIYLSLGSNIGDRFDNLQRAVDSLGAIMAIEALSPVYETDPWGLVEQPSFLNSCLRGKTQLEPKSLLSSLKEIEKRLGRTPGERWGPRLIDIDIIYYDGEVIREDGLNIPHPGAAERAFVLAPLADIASSFRDPVSGLQVAEMLLKVGRNGVTRDNNSSRKLRRPAALAWGIKTYVMGILNITPDSFSGDGLLPSDSWLEDAAAQGRRFAAAGADILDIGGESTRPGGEPISPELEMKRVLPVIEAVHAETDLPISIDTYHADVAAAAIEAGADWINDVWGLRMDSRMAEVAASYGCPVVIMHNRSKPKNAAQDEILGGRYVGIEYEDLLSDVAKELMTSVDLGLKAGIRPDKIILDPGFGFGKTVEQNLQLLNQLDRLKDLGYPILAGTSRKSFIGYTLGGPPADRVHGTAATVAIAIDRGADIVRVHDVEIMAKVAAMTDSIVRSERSR